MKGQQYIIYYIMLFATSAYSQQVPLFSKYENYYGYFNAASVNSNNYFTQQDSYLTIGTLHRRQWIASEAFDIYSTIGQIEYFNGVQNLTASGYIIIDRVGAFSNKELSMRLSKNTDMDNKFWVGGGLNFSLNIHNLDYSEFISNSSEENQGSKLSDNTINAGLGLIAGMTLHDDEYLHIGISVPKAMEQELNFIDDSFNYNLPRHFFGQFGYYKSFGYDYINLVSLVKYLPNLPLHTDINFTYKTKYPLYVGLGSSFSNTLNAFHLELGFEYNIREEDKITFGVGLDIVSNPHYSGPTGTSLEFNLLYLFEVD